MVEAKLLASELRPQRRMGLFGFPLPLGRLVETYGRNIAKAIQCAMYDSVDDVGRVCELEGIDALYRKSGVLISRVLRSN